MCGNGRAGNSWAALYRSQTQLFVRHAQRVQQTDDREISGFDHGALLYLPHGRYGHPGSDSELLLSQADLLANLP